MFDLAKELWLFLKENKKFWLLPIMVIMGLFAILLVFGQSSAINRSVFLHTVLIADVAQTSRWLAAGMR